MSERQEGHLETRQGVISAACSGFLRWGEFSGAEPGREALRVLLTVALVGAGAVALMPLWLHMSRIWLHDPLRAIGVAFPVIATVGVLSAWRSMGWRAEGSLWGLVPVALSIALSGAVSNAPYAEISQGGFWREIHSGPVLFLYGAGATLLFGGWRLLRAALLPLLLLLCINPVPRSFNAFFDMPLQELSAGTARGFAHLIGLHPTGLQLRMMFSPDFGMMIVPGCNGVRGAVTFAYLTLIYGYSKGLRSFRLAGIALSGLLFGYAMNLLRLCVLVVYYRIGLWVPAIQSYGTGVDYAIGVTIFLTATFGFGFLIRRVARAVAGEGRVREAVCETAGEPSATFVGGRRFYLQAVCLMALTVVPIVRAVRSISASPLRQVDVEEIARSLPRVVGPYKLVRTYTEQQYSVGGSPLFLFAEYARTDGADGAARPMVLGLFLASGYHRVMDSKSVQGVHPEWTGSFEARSGSKESVALGVSSYDDGEARQYNAETSCTVKICTDPLLDYRKFRPSDYITDGVGKRLPVLLREEWGEKDAASSAELRARFQADVTAFVGALDLGALVTSAGTALD